MISVELSFSQKTGQAFRVPAVRRLVGNVPPFGGVFRDGDDGHGNRSSFADKTRNIFGIVSARIVIVGPYHDPTALHWVPVGHVCSL